MAFQFKRFVPGDQWDSELIVPSEVANATLRLVVRLELTNHDKESLTLDKRDFEGRRIKGETIEIKTRPWDSAEWESFRRSVKTLCERHWNDQFYLQTPKEYDGIDVPYTRLGFGPFSVQRTTPTHRPYVRCEVQIKLYSGASSGAPHRKITVLRLDDGEKGIRHSARLWDHHAINWREIRKGKVTYRQLPVVHEFGHLLELYHPGVGVVEGCTKEDNSQMKCYCVDGWCGELLGAGMEITNRLAEPWQISMKNHTGVAQDRWRVFRSPMPPETITRAFHRDNTSSGAAGLLLSH